MATPITPITFKNADVAANYVALTGTDVTVSTVAKTAKGTVPQYKGKLSNITRAVAAGMVRRKNPMIALKPGCTLEDAPAATPTATPPPPPSSTATTTPPPSSGATVEAPTVDAKATPGK